VLPPSSSGGTVRFGDFDVDLGSGKFRKHGIRSKLEVQPFQVPEVLCEHACEGVHLLCPPNVSEPWDHREIFRTDFTGDGMVQDLLPGNAWRGDNLHAIPNGNRPASSRFLFQKF
jgi:hypothetical protein